MTADDYYTYNELTNEDKELLLRNGYRPGELPQEDEHELLQDLHNQVGNDEDSDKLSSDIPDLEKDDL